MLITKLSKSIVGQREIDAIANVVLKDGYLGMGKEVQAFENEIAIFLGVSRGQVVAVNSGTSAVLLAVQSLLNPGDEVLVQSLTFVATYQAIRAAGAVPISCEINCRDGTIDLHDAANRITDKTRAIMPVHYASNPGNLDAIYHFAQTRNLRVIEDAAHAFGCRYKGKMIGSFGDVQCFSFDGIKNITTGEGGAIVSNDQALLDRLRDSRLLGVERDTDRRFKGERSWDFDVKRTGYRSHLSNILAAVGRVQLERFPTEFAPKRIALAKLYRSALEGLPGLELFDTSLGDIIPHIQPIRVTNGSRDLLRSRLASEGIETGIHYKPNHLLSLFGNGHPKLPVTERIYSQLVSLPLHPEIHEDDVNKICAAIHSHLRK